MVSRFAIPVMFRIFIISGFIWITRMLPCLFMIFCVDTSTRRPAEVI